MLGWIKTCWRKLFSPHVRYTAYIDTQGHISKVTYHGSQADAPPEVLADYRRMLRHTQEARQELDALLYRMEQRYVEQEAAKEKAKAQKN